MAQDDLTLRIGLETSNAGKELQKFKTEAIREFKKLQSAFSGSSGGKKSSRGPIVDALDASQLNKLVNNARMIGRVSGTLKTFGINMGMVYDDLGQFGDIAKHAALTTQKSLEKPIKQAEKVKNRELLSASSTKFQTGLLKTGGGLGIDEMAMFKGHLKSLNKEFGDTLTMQQKQAEALKRTKAEVSSMKEPFQGWALSIMFAGMAMKNTFNTIWASSTKTFNDVMHSTEGTVTGFDMLDGSLKYLGFTAGQALEPIALFLVPIIDKIADWISMGETLGIKNSTLFASIVAALGVGGTVLTAIGMSVLSFSGFVEGIQKASLAFDALKGKNWSGLASTIQKSVGTVAILWSLEQAHDAYKAFAENGDMITGLEKALSSLALATGGWLLWKGKTGAGGAALAIGVGMEWLSENTFFQNAGFMVGWIVAAFATAMESIKSKWAIGWKGIASSIIDSLTPLTAVFGLIGISLGDKLVGIEPEFDWSSTFLKHMQTINQAMRGMDQDLANYKKDVMDPFLVKDMAGTSLSDDYVKTLVDVYDFKDEGQLLANIGTVQINVQQNQGESNIDFAQRIAEAMRKELNKVTN